MGWSGGRWGTNLTTEMNTNDIQDTATKAAQQGVKPHRLIKLGVDVHWGQSEGVNPLVAAGGRRTPEAGRRRTGDRNRKKSRQFGLGPSATFASFCSILEGRSEGVCLLLVNNW